MGSCGSGQDNGRAHVNTVMKLRVQQKTCNFLTICANIRLPTRALDLAVIFFLSDMLRAPFAHRCARPVFICSELQFYSSLDLPRYRHVNEVLILRPLKRVRFGWSNRSKWIAKKNNTKTSCSAQISSVINHVQNSCT